MKYLKTYTDGKTEFITRQEAIDQLEEAARLAMAEEEGVDLTHEDFDCPDMGIYFDILNIFDDENVFETKQFIISKVN